MDSNFFRHVCENVDINDYTDEVPYLQLERCQCNGRDYGGMPTFDIQKKSGFGSVESSDHDRFYNFEPS